MRDSGSSQGETEDSSADKTNFRSATDSEHRAIPPETPVPASWFVRFLLQTRFMRVIGQRLLRTYRIKLPQGPTLYLRSRFGFDAATVNEVVFKRIYERLFKPEAGDKVFDVGAHIGSFTLIAASEVGPNGMVIALEPSTSNFQVLKRNVEANPDLKIMTFQFAAGQAEGSRDLILYQRSGGNSFYDRELETVGRERVKVVTLDSLADSLGIGRVDFVKIDAEGAELEILHGAQRVLNSYHPKLVLETHDFGPPVSGLVAYLNNLGYEVQTSPYGPRLGLLYASWSRAA